MIVLDVDSNDMDGDDLFVFGNSELALALAMDRPNKMNNLSNLKSGAIFIVPISLRGCSRYCNLTLCIRLMMYLIINCAAAAAAAYIAR